MPDSMPPQFMPWTPERHEEKKPDPILLGGMLDVRVSLRGLECHVNDYVDRVMDGFKEIAREEFQKAITKLDVRAEMARTAQHAIRSALETAGELVGREVCERLVADAAKEWASSPEAQAMVQQKIREHIANETAYAVSAAIRTTPMFSRLGKVGLRELMKKRRAT